MNGETGGEIMRESMHIRFLELAINKTNFKSLYIAITKNACIAL